MERELTAPVVAGELLPEPVSQSVGRTAVEVLLANPDTQMNLPAKPDDTTYSMPSGDE